MHALLAAAKWLARQIIGAVLLVVLTALAFGALAFFRAKAAGDSCVVIRARGPVTYVMHYWRDGEQYVSAPARVDKRQTLVIERGGSLFLAGFWDSDGKPIKSFIWRLHEHGPSKRFCIK